MYQKYLQVLLDRGLDENHRDNAGWGPLHYASFEGHSVIVKLLGGSLLLELSTINHELCAGNAGAELDMTDCDAKTGLHLACSEGHYDVVVQLLRAGANVNLVNLQVNTRVRHVRGVGRCNSCGKKTTTSTFTLVNNSCRIQNFMNFGFLGF